MAKVVNIFSSMDEDMKDYHKRIWKHRAALIIRYVIIGALVLLAFLGIRYYLNNRSFTGYSIVASTERNDTLTTKYAFFGNKILKYSRDGVSYTDDSNSLLFNITYTMQEPMVALSSKMGVVADKNGNQIYTFDQSKQTGQITTLLPIKHVAVSNQGVVAVIQEDSNLARLEVYDSEGAFLADGEFTLEDAGYPMGLSISSDGTKIAITFAQVSGTMFGSCVAVYNFDNVGENHVDNLVFAKEYDTYMIPEIHYFDASTLVAVGDGIMGFYQGSQIPEIVKEVTFEEEIKSVFYGENTVGLVFDASEGKVIKLYDVRGNLTAEIPFDLNYDNIRILDNRIIAYNDTEMGLYSYDGKECFRHEFDSSVVDIFPTNSRSRYLFIYANETQLIKLQ